MRSAPGLRRSHLDRAKAGLDPTSQSVPPSIWAGVAITARTQGSLNGTDKGGQCAAPLRLKRSR